MARPLTDWELRTLQALTDADYPGADQLRAQLLLTTVTGESHHSDAVFISLSVDAERVGPAALDGQVTADWELDSGWSGYTLLFLKDGYLRELELHMNMGFWPMVSLPDPNRLRLNPVE